MGSLGVGARDLEPLARAGGLGVPTGSVFSESVFTESVWDKLWALAEGIGILVFRMQVGGC